MEKMKKNYSEQSKLVLYTPGVHLGCHLFTTIGAAIWLSKKPGYNKTRKSTKQPIEIVFLPVGSKFFLRRPLLTLKQIVISLLGQLPKKWKEKLPTRFQIKRKRINSQSLFHQIYSGKTVCFTHEKMSFSIKLFRERVFQHGLLWMHSIVRAYVLWRGCFKEKAFIPSYFLELSYQGIHIGDLAASDTLRAKPKLGGSLQACRMLFNKLADAIYICDLAKTLSFNTKAEYYVMEAERTYLHAVYQRSLHALGAHIITSNSYNKNISVTPTGQVFSNPAFVLPSEYGVIDTQKVISYMNGRLLNLKKYLWYMSGSVNNNASEMINDIYGKSIDISGTGLKVIVFLHSFDDAQYDFGLDGFDDIFQWTIFTIDNCLMNRSIDKVLIKSHPNVNIQEYPGEKVAFNRIFHKYKGKPRVIFLDKTCSLVALSKKGKLYGITHHGSVAEEMVYLKQPVIASVHAPWGVNYPFVKAWNTVEEYKNIIKSISRQGWSPPSKAQKEWLFRYVHEYRFKAIPINEKTSWMKFAGLLTGEKIEITNKYFWRYNYHMENLAPKTQRFNDFLNVLSHDK